jgi:hypothetical protein
MKVKCTSSFYIVNKGIFDNGSIVEFDDELALKLIKQGVVVEYVEEVEAIEKEENDYNNMTVKELKVLLEEKGLSTKGKKAELIQRLEEN